MANTYSGGCQCGKVRYEVDLALGEVVACNCSRCGRLAHCWRLHRSNGSGCSGGAALPATR